MLAVGALIEQLRKHAVGAVDAIFAVEHPVGVEISFAVLTQVTQVAVARIECEVAVVAVLDILIVEGCAWDEPLEIDILFEEWTREVERTSILQRIPVIAPPLPSLVDRER